MVYTFRKVGKKDINWSIWFREKCTHRGYYKDVTELP